MVDDRPPDPDPLSDAELDRRIAVLEHNLHELRTAARTLACEHAEGTATELGNEGERDRGDVADTGEPVAAETFEALDRALEDAEAALPDPDLDTEETRRAYWRVIHRLQDVRGSFRERVVDAVDDAVEGRLERWE